MRILVADDDEMFLKVATEILEGGGHEVLLARDGIETLEKTYTQKPDLIILDIILPGLLGTEVVEKLRKCKETTPVPIVLVSSGAAEMKGEADARRYLAEDFLRKPFHANELLKRVERFGGKVSEFSAGNQDNVDPGE